MVLRATQQHAEILAAGDGDARVTQQYVEILTLGSGDIRVTRQRVDILIGDISDEDTIGFSDSVEIIWSPEDTIVYTDDAHLLVVYRQLEETIGTTESVSYWHNNLKVTETINYTEATVARFPIIYEYDLADTIVYTTSADYTIIPFIHDVADSIGYLEVADTSSKGRSPNDTFAVTDAIIVDATVKTQGLLDGIFIIEEILVAGTQSFTVEEYITNDIPQYEGDDLFYDSVGLGDSVLYDHIAPRPIEESIFLTDSILVEHNKLSGQPLWAEDTLTLTENIGSPAGAAVDTIAYTETLIYQNDSPIIDSIVYTDTIIVIKIFIPVLTDDFNIGDSIGYTLERNDTLCTYSPFVGSTTDSDAPTPPATTAPTIVNYGNVELSYESTTLLLRGPEFGNRTMKQYQRIDRKTRGGTLIVYADPIWPKQQRMLLDFYALNEAETQEVIDFVALSLGKQFSIRDWEGQTWVGVIPEPNNAVFRDRRDINSVSLEIIVQKLYVLSVEDTLVYLETILTTEVSDTITYTDTAVITVLDWKTFTEAEWLTFGRFEWEAFIEA